MQNLQKLATLLKTKSERVNLFSTRDRELLGEKHIPDSLAILEFCELYGSEDQVLQVADIGTGGGLPGLALAIARPGTDFTLIDSRQKKIEAVQEVVDELGLENVHTVSGRFERLAHDTKFRKKFDIVTARAVAPLPTLLEYVAGFLKLKGEFYAWKGVGYETELESAKKAMHVLGLEFVEGFEYELPGVEKRVVLKFVKNGDLHEKYPRRDGVPKAKPI
jgi:16S rRNA (guanine527-N7)-methyltransferase